MTKKARRASRTDLLEFNDEFREVFLNDAPMAGVIHIVIVVHDHIA